MNLSKSHQTKKSKNTKKVKNKVDSVSPAQVGGTHYSDQVIEPIVYAIVNKLGPLETKVVKYITRHPHKNKLQDIRKARHCLEMIEDFYYGDQNKLQETIDKINKFMSENESD